MPETTDDVETNCVDVPWKCDRCQALLAYALCDTFDLTHLRFKIRDLYIKVLEPLEVRATCRKCGWDNVLLSKRREEIFQLFKSSSSSDA